MISIYNINVPSLTAEFDLISTFNKPNMYYQELDLTINVIVILVKHFETCFESFN